MYSEIDVAIAKFSMKVSTINTAKKQKKSSTRSTPSSRGPTENKTRQQFSGEETDGSDSDYQVNLSGFESESEGEGSKENAYGSDYDDFVCVPRKRKNCNRVVQQKRQSDDLGRNDELPCKVVQSHVLKELTRAPEVVLAAPQQLDDNIARTCE
jgi:hypothetical protein